MKQLSMRVVALSVLMLGLNDCGSDSVVLVLHVKNLTPDVSALKVSAILDGKDAKQAAEFTQRLSEVAVTVPRDEIGQGQLSVNLFGLAADRCKLSAVRIDVSLSADTRYSEQDVSLALLPSKLCTLTVEKDGDGSVVSSPLGIDCGIRCELDVMYGATVKLSATGTPFTMNFWNGDCTGTEATCDVPMTQARRVGVTLEPEVRPKMIRVPKGAFTMGSPTSEVGRNGDETQHSVTLTVDFAMAETEVTQRQYRNLMGNNPSYFVGDELPVEKVSWLDAVAYCNALSVKENLPPCYQIAGANVLWQDGVKCTGYRLPTEAEWEYAARAPTTTLYAGSNNVDDVAWYSSGAGNTTHPVKTKMANGRGLYDLSGNVFEWLWDLYLPNYETLTPVDPMGPSSGADRVVRGGSWGYTAVGARVAYRDRFAPTIRSQGLGIRPTRSYP